MKMKYLVIVSLILAILTIGAASASEDVISDDSLAVDDGGDEQIVESPADEGDEQVLESPIDDEGTLSQSKNFDDGVSIMIMDEINSNERYDYGNPIAGIMDGTRLNGTISLSVDNVQCYNKQVTGSDMILYITVSELTLPDNLKSGSHNVALTYLKNGVSTPYTYSQTSNFTYSPTVYYEDVSVGETAYVFIEHLSGSSGTATLYNYNGYIGSAVGTVSISDGKAKFAIPGLAKGEHEYYLNMTINGKNYGRNLEIDVEQNTAGFSSAVSAAQIVSGNNVVITVTGPKTKSMVYIYVDGKPLKGVSMMYGSVSESISGLAIGQHQIKVLFDENNMFYSNTLTVDVKAPAVADTISLVLKAVKVKKSAKKLVLKATLKINKKAVKGKKITFKFNGKKYTAKTNKNGVAKVTIKKKVLKKLKVGKKVKYQVSYSTKTVKKTAKVTK